MAVGVKATAWPPLESPLDATSGRYGGVLCSPEQAVVV